MKRLLVFAVVALVGLPFSAALAQPSQEQPKSSPGAQGGAAQTGRSGAQITSESLVGTTVRDGQGKNVGQVSQLLIDAKEGKVTSVIIKRGGAFGLGGQEVSVPWDSLKIQRDQDDVVVTIQQELLEQAPAASPATRPQDQQQRQEQQQPKQQ
jgi:sporulation protein YlmC with PRC-barrel domain